MGASAKCWRLSTRWTRRRTWQRSRIISSRRCRREARRRRSPTASEPRGTLKRPWRTRTRRSCSSARSRSSRKRIRPTRASAASCCSPGAARSGRPAMGPGHVRRSARPPTSRDGSETRRSWLAARSASPGRARVCSGCGAGSSTNPASSCSRRRSVAADREIEAWAQIAGELRQPRYLTDLAMWRATRAIMDGRFAEGEEHARRALELGEREPEVEPAMRHAVQMTVLQFHRGQLEHAIGAAAPRSYAPAAMLLRCHRIFWWSETGRMAEARRDLRALAKDGFPLPRDGGWLVYTSLLAAVAAELNDRASAARLYDLLLPYAGRLGIVGAGLACWGSISCYLGLLASALGRVADATRHFEDAAEVHERIGARPFLAWTQFAHARLLLTCDPGARREATTLLTNSLATARELGMDGLVTKIRRLGLETAATVG